MNKPKDISLHGRLLLIAFSKLTERKEGTDGHRRKHRGKFAGI